MGASEDSKQDGWTDRHAGLAQRQPARQGRTGQGGQACKAHQGVHASCMQQLQVSCPEHWIQPCPATAYGLAFALPIDYLEHDARRGSCLLEQLQGWLVCRQVLQDGQHCWQTKLTTLLLGMRGVNQQQ